MTLSLRAKKLDGVEAIKIDDIEGNSRNIFKILIQPEKIQLVTPSASAPSILLPNIYVNMIVTNLIYVFLEKQLNTEENLCFARHMRRKSGWY